MGSSIKHNLTLLTCSFVSPFDDHPHPLEGPSYASRNKYKCTTDTGIPVHCSTYTHPTIASLNQEHQPDSVEATTEGYRITSFTHGNYPAPSAGCRIEYLEVPLLFTGRPDNKNSIWRCTIAKKKKRPEELNPTERALQGD